MGNRIATLVASISFLILSLVARSAFGCDFPDPVSIPNGKTATKHEMAAAGRAMEKYFDQYEKYVACVESDTKTRRKSAVRSDISSSRLREEEAARKLNAAAAAIEDLAERFNKATADYESRSQ
jgi:predicted phage gp36 major capsid-like protein